MNLSEEKTGEISMAIIESCINAFEHSKTKEIYIHFIVSDDKLTVKVIDQGKGFDKSKVEIPNIENKLKADARKRGWGLQLVAELMDTVEYDSTESGTTVTMTKKKEDNE
jgi:serine/threonine-protein kinase RsbW